MPAGASESGGRSVRKFFSLLRSLASDQFVALCSRLSRNQRIYEFIRNALPEILPLKSLDSDEFSALCSELNRNPALYKVIRGAFPEIISSIGWTAANTTNRRRWALVQKTSYEIGSSLNTDQKMVFLNLGYAGLDDEKTVALDPADEINRFSIQLYHHHLQFTDLRGKDILEVGCGRGGGCEYIARQCQSKSVLGIDFARSNVDFCNRVHSSSGLSFAVGRAEALVLDDDSKDILINIESSHCYASVGTFFREVHRVLRPGGLFLFADIRRTEEPFAGYERVETLEEQLRASQLEVIRRENITPNVMKALELSGNDQAKRWEAALDGSLGGDPTSMQLLKRVIFTEVTNAFCQGDNSHYRHFEKGQAEYLSYILRKPLSR